jgi:hypothetical protein
MYYSNFYFFEEHFTKEELKRLNFMNPLPCMKVPFLHVYILYKQLH